MRGLLYKINHTAITSFAERNALVFATCMQCFMLNCLRKIKNTLLALELDPAEHTKQR